MILIYHDSRSSGAAKQPVAVRVNDMCRTGIYLDVGGADAEACHGRRLRFTRAAGWDLGGSQVAEPRHSVSSQEPVTHFAHRKTCRRMSFQVHASRAGVGMHRPGAFCIGDAPKFLPRAQGRLFFYFLALLRKHSHKYTLGRKNSENSHQACTLMSKDSNIFNFAAVNSLLFYGKEVIFDNETLNPK